MSIAVTNVFITRGSMDPNSSDTIKFTVTFDKTLDANQDFTSSPNAYVTTVQGGNPLKIVAAAVGATPTDTIEVELGPNDGTWSTDSNKEAPWKAHSASHGVPNNSHRNSSEMLGNKPHKGYLFTGGNDTNVSFNSERGLRMIGQASTSNAHSIHHGYFGNGAMNGDYTNEVEQARAFIGSEVENVRLGTVNHSNGQSDTVIITFRDYYSKEYVPNFPLTNNTTSANLPLELAYKNVDQDQAFTRKHPNPGALGVFFAAEPFTVRSINIVGAGNGSNPYNSQYNTNNFYQSMDDDPNSHWNFNGWGAGFGDVFLKYKMGGDHTQTSAVTGATDSQAGPNQALAEKVILRYTGATGDFRTDRLPDLSDYFNAGPDVDEGFYAHLSQTMGRPVQYLMITFTAPVTKDILTNWSDNVYIQPVSNDITAINAFEVGTPFVRHGLTDEQLAAKGADMNQSMTFNADGSVDSTSVLYAHPSSYNTVFVPITYRWDDAIPAGPAQHWGYTSDIQEYTPQPDTINNKHNIYPAAYPANPNAWYPTFQSGMKYGKYNMVTHGSVSFKITFKMGNGGLKDAFERNINFDHVTFTEGTTITKPASGSKPEKTYSTDPSGRMKKTNGDYEFLWPRSYNQANATVKDASALVAADYFDIEDYTTKPQRYYGSGLDVQVWQGGVPFRAPIQLDYEFGHLVHGNRTDRQRAFYMEIINCLQTGQSLNDITENAIYAYSPNKTVSYGSDGTSNNPVTYAGTRLRGLSAHSGGDLPRTTDAQGNFNYVTNSIRFNGTINTNVNDLQSHLASYFNITGAEAFDFVVENSGVGVNDQISYKIRMTNMNTAGAVAYYRSNYELGVGGINSNNYSSTFFQSSLNSPAPTRLVSTDVVNANSLYKSGANYILHQNAQKGAQSSIEIDFTFETVPTSEELVISNWFQNEATLAFSNFTQVGSSGLVYRISVTDPTNDSGLSSQTTTIQFTSSAALHPNSTFTPITIQTQPIHILPVLTLSNNIINLSNLSTTATITSEVHGNSSGDAVKKFDTNYHTDDLISIIIEDHNGNRSTKSRVENGTNNWTVSNKTTSDTLFTQTLTFNTDFLIQNNTANVEISLFHSGGSTSHSLRSTIGSYVLAHPSVTETALADAVRPTLTNMTQTIIRTGGNVTVAAYDVEDSSQFPYLRIGDQLQIVYTFNEAINLAASNIRVSNGASLVSNPNITLSSSADNTQKTVVYTPGANIASETHTVQIGNFNGTPFIADLAGNARTDSSSVTIGGQDVTVGNFVSTPAKIDTVAPTVTLAWKNGFDTITAIPSATHPTYDPPSYNTNVGGDNTAIYLQCTFSESLTLTRQQLIDSFVTTQGPITVTASNPSTAVGSFVELTVAASGAGVEAYSGVSVTLANFTDVAGNPASASASLALAAVDNILPLAESIQVNATEYGIESDQLPTQSYLTLIFSEEIVNPSTNAFALKYQLHNDITFEEPNNWATLTSFDNGNINVIDGKTHYTISFRANEGVLNIGSPAPRVKFETGLAVDRVGNNQVSTVSTSQNITVDTRPFNVTLGLSNSDAFSSTSRSKNATLTFSIDVNQTAAQVEADIEVVDANGAVSEDVFITSVTKSGKVFTAVLQSAMGQSASGLKFRMKNSLTYVNTQNSARTSTFNNEIALPLVDTIPPVLSSINIADNTLGANQTTTMTIVFNEAMNTTATESYIIQSTPNIVNLTNFAWSNGNKTLVVTIQAKSTISTPQGFTLALSNAIKDAAGNALATATYSGFGNAKAAGLASGDAITLNGATVNYTREVTGNASITSIAELLATGALAVDGSLNGTKITINGVTHYLKTIGASSFTAYTDINNVATFDFQTPTTTFGPYYNTDHGDSIYDHWNQVTGTNEWEEAVPGWCGNNIPIGSAAEIQLDGGTIITGTTTRLLPGSVGTYTGSLQDASTWQQIYYYGNSTQGNYYSSPKHWPIEISGYSVLERRLTSGTNPTGIWTRATFTVSNPDTYSVADGLVYNGSNSINLSEVTSFQYVTAASTGANAATASLHVDAIPTTASAMIRTNKTVGAPDYDKLNRQQQATMKITFSEEIANTVQQLEAMLTLDAALMLDAGSPSLSANQKEFTFSVSRNQNGNYESYSAVTDHDVIFSGTIVDSVGNSTSVTSSFTFVSLDFLAPSITSSSFVNSFTSSSGARDVIINFNETLEDKMYDNFINTKIVTVASGVFVIDGEVKPVLDLKKGTTTYRFDVSDGSMTNHPLRFKDAAGNSFNTGVTISGTTGEAGATVTLVVPSSGTQPASYYCQIHGAGMGNSITTSTGVEGGTTFVMTGGLPDATPSELVTPPFTAWEGQIGQSSNQKPLSHFFEQATAKWETLTKLVVTLRAHNNLTQSGISYGWYFSTFDSNGNGTSNLSDTASVSFDTRDPSILTREITFDFAGNGPITAANNSGKFKIVVSEQVENPSLSDYSVVEIATGNTKNGLFTFSNLVNNSNASTDKHILVTYTLVEGAAVEHAANTFRFKFEGTLTDMQNNSVTRSTDLAFPRAIDSLGASITSMTIFRVENGNEIESTYINASSTGKIVIVYSEPLGTTFTAADLKAQLSNADVSISNYVENINVSVSGNTVTFTFSAKANTESGSNLTLGITKSVLDAVGNAAQAAQFKQVIIDTASPSVQNILSAGKTSLLFGQTDAVSIGFREVLHADHDATNLGGLLTTNNGSAITISNPQRDDTSGRTIFTATVAPNNNVSASNVSITFNGTVKDIYNNSVAVNNSITYTSVSTVRPALSSFTVTSTIIGNMEASNRQAVIVFNKEIVQTADQIKAMLSSGHASITFGAASTADNITYNVELVAGGTSGQDNVVISLNGSVTDVFGNTSDGNVTGSATIVRVDTVAPGISSIYFSTDSTFPSTGEATARLGAAGHLFMYVVFTEEIQDIASLSSNLPIAMTLDGQAVAITDYLTIQAASHALNSGKTMLRVKIKAKSGVYVRENLLIGVVGNIIDAAGNAAAISLGSTNGGAAIIVDGVLPEIVSVVLDKTQIKKGETAKLLVTFSESIHGSGSTAFGHGAFDMLNNGEAISTANILIQQGPGDGWQNGTDQTDPSYNTQFQYTVTPSDDVVFADVKIAFASILQDMAGNVSSQLQEVTSSFVVDTELPYATNQLQRPSSASGTPNRISTAASETQLQLLVNFNEAPVTTAAYLKGQLQALQTGGSNVATGVTFGTATVGNDAAFGGHYFLVNVHANADTYYPNGVTVSFKSGTTITDAVGHENTLSSSYAIDSVDTAKPTVTSVTMVDNKTNFAIGETGVIKVAFSEAISTSAAQLTQSLRTSIAHSFTVPSDGTLTNDSANNQFTFKATIVPIADVDSKTVALQFLGDIADNYGNTNTQQQASVSVTVDTLRPSAPNQMVATRTTLNRNNRTDVISLTFSELLHGDITATTLSSSLSSTGLNNVSSGLTFSQHTLETVDVNGVNVSRYRFNVTAALDRSDINPVTISLTNASIKDLLGNTATISSSFSYSSVKTNLPAVVSVVPSFTLMNVATSGVGTVKVTFSEPVVTSAQTLKGYLGFTGSTTGNMLSFSNPIMNNTNTELTCTVTALQNKDVAELKITFRGSITDGYGNTFVMSFNDTVSSTGFLLDTNAPTVVGHLNSGNNQGVSGITTLKKGQTDAVTITFSSKLSNNIASLMSMLTVNPADSVTFSNGVLSNDDKTFGFTVTPKPNFESSSDTVVTMAGTISDLNSNNTALSSTLTYTQIDTLQVAVTSDLALTRTTLKLGETATLSIQFSSPIGETASELKQKITLGNGLSLAQGNGVLDSTTNEYSIAVLPNNNVTKTTPTSVTFNGTVTDLIGNVTNVNQSVQITKIDTIVPTANALSKQKASLAKGQSDTLSITFSEPIQQDATQLLAMLSVSEANRITFSTQELNTGANAVFTVVATPIDNIDVGETTITMSGTINDIIGNPQTINTSVSYSRIDTIHVTPGVLTKGKNTMKIGETDTLSISFSEQLQQGATDLLNLITVNPVGAVTFSNAAIDASHNFAATVTPASDISQSVTISISGNINDTIGNQIALDSSVSYTLIDTTAVVPGNLTKSRASLKNGETDTISLSFSEPIQQSAADLLAMLTVSPAGAATLSNHNYNSLNNVFTVLVTPQANRSSGAQVTVTINGSVDDQIGNTTLLDNSVTYTFIETTLPTLVSLSVSDDQMLIGETSTLTVTFSEVLNMTATQLEALLTASSNLITIGNSNLATNGSNQSVYTCVLTPAAGQDRVDNITVTMEGNVVDAFGNIGAINSTSGNMSLDTLSTSTGALGSTNNSTFLNANNNTDTLAVTFSESIQGDATQFANSFTVNPPGAVTFGTPQLNDKTVSVAVTAANNRQVAGNVTVGFQSTVLDTLGNSSSITANFTYSYVETGFPVITSYAINDSLLSKSETAVLTIVFNEAVIQTAAQLKSILESNKSNSLTLSNESLSVDGLTFTVTVTPDDDHTETGVFLNFVGDIQDAFGNVTSVGAGEQGITNIVVDTLLPTVGDIILGQNTLRFGETTTLSVTFSELINENAVVLGNLFSVSPVNTLSLYNWSKSTITVSGIDKTVLSANVQPVGTISRVENGVSITMAGTFTDLNENTSNPVNKTTTFSVVDTERPTVEDMNLKINGNSITTLLADQTAILTIDFSEAMLTSANNILTALQFNSNYLSVGPPNMSADKKKFTANVSAANNTVEQENLEIKLTLAGITDLLGNPPSTLDNAKINNLVVDSKRPTVLGMTLSDRRLIIGDTSLLTITFSEATGNSVTDLIGATPGNGLLAYDTTKFTIATAAGQGLNNDNTIFTATITPQPNVTERNSISIVLSGYRDVLGNIASTDGNAIVEVVDTVAPTCSFNLLDNLPTIKKGSHADFFLQFSETLDITSLPNPLEALVTITNTNGGALGSITNGTLDSSQNRISYRYTPADNLQRSGIVLAVNGDSYSDAEGNLGGDASANFEIDTHVPGVTQFTMERNNLSIVNNTTNAVLIFSEPVDLLPQNCLHVGNSNAAIQIGNPVQADGSTDKTRWRIPITAKTNVTRETNVAIAVKDYKDLAGNTQTTASQSAAISVVDTVSPTVLSFTASLPSSVVAEQTRVGSGQKAQIALVFSEEVVGFSKSDITVKSINGVVMGTLDDFQSQDNINFSSLFTFSAGNISFENAADMLTLSNQYQDTNTNQGVSSTLTQTVAFDSLHPSVSSFTLEMPAIAGGTASRLNSNQTLPYTLTLNEVVTSTFNQQTAMSTLPAGKGSFSNHQLVSSTDGNGNPISLLKGLFTPNSDQTVQNVKLVIAPNAYTDLAGNTNNLGAESLAFFIDTENLGGALTVTLPAGDIALIRDNNTLQVKTATVTLNANEAVDVLLDDFSVVDASNTPFGTFSNLTSNAAKTMWQVTLTPFASRQTTDVVVKLAKTVDIIADGPSVGNVGSEIVSASFIIDTQQPVVESFVVDINTSTYASSIPVTLVFNEPVPGFDSDRDIEVPYGTLQPMTSQDNITWTGSYIPQQYIATPAFSLVLNKVYTDRYGNSSIVAANSNSFKLDTFGDPYIRTLAGEIYKLDNSNGNFRMLQGTVNGKKLIVNVGMEIDSADSENRMNSYTKSHLTGKGNTDLTMQSFYTKLHVVYDKEEAHVDLRSGAVNATSGLSKMITRLFSDTCALPIYGSEKTLGGCAIKVGDVSIEARLYENPQIRNCISVVGAENIKNADGFIVRPMRTKQCRIRNISDSKTMKMKEACYKGKITETFYRNNAAVNKWTINKV